MTTPRVLLCLPAYAGPNHATFVGIRSLAACLLEADIPTCIFDCSFARFTAAKSLNHHQEILRKTLDEFKPTLVGISCNAVTYPAALNLVADLRSYYDGPIVLGGPYPTAAGSSILHFHPEIDFVLKGESESSLKQLAYATVGNKNNSLISSIPGICFREGEQPISSRTLSSSMPVPYYHLMCDLVPSCLKLQAHDFYRRNFYNHIAAFRPGYVVNSCAARGCPHSCSFCAPGVLWLNPRTRRPQRIIRSIDHMRMELQRACEDGITAVYFDEMAFPIGEIEWITQFCRLTEKLALEWGASIILDELDLSLLPQFKTSGLRYLYFGLESPSPKVQEKIGKQIDMEYCLSTISTCREMGIQCDVSLMFGAEGETKADVEYTIEWLNRNLPHGNAFFSLAAYWPGTKWSIERHLVPAHWEPEEFRPPAPKNCIFFPHHLASIDKFFSNSVGTWHPASLTPDRALEIRDAILASGFRDRFAQYARRGRPI